MSIDQFIERHIYCCLTAIVEHCSTLDLEFQDQIYCSLTVTCSECDGKGYKDDGDPCLYCDSEGSLTREPLEWWGVSDFLARKLESKGEVVIKEFNLCLWGRSCSGVSLSYDPQIIDVFGEIQ